jgi:uncharacterized phage protein (TIGR01671 family)
MRPIKFKVWDKELKQYNSPNAHHLSKEGETLSIILNSDIEKISGNDRFVIQQYTGLKDKNDKEICEGDIVHYLFDGASYPKEAQDKYLTCVYDSDFGGFSFDDTDSSYYWAEIRGYVEVVGNIFENPELLK